MVADHKQNHLETVRSGLSVVLYPLQFAVNAPFKFARWTSQNLQSRKELLQENNRLKKEQFLSNARTSQYDALEAENTRLRLLLDSSKRVAQRVLIAEIMSVEMDPFSRKILLNKGSRDGVFKGQPLIDAQGVMGQVVHETEFTSTALLITDPSHALPVQLNRNGIRTLAVGKGASNSLELLHLPTNADVTVGDKVSTSGLGQRFPAGYPVGEVQQVSVDAGLPFLSVIVKPVAQLERNREVLLLWRDEPETGPVLEQKPDVEVEDGKK